MTPPEFFFAVYAIGMDISKNTNGGVWIFISKVEALIKKWKEEDANAENRNK